MRFKLRMGYFHQGLLAALIILLKNIAKAMHEKQLKKDREFWRFLLHGLEKVAIKARWLSPAHNLLK
ncbi:hypothetical protein ACFRAM_10650 [Paenibacillus sp. NPDC056722]|uniref:hypothetical protein n=1 Tax=Paenibacillus sp. NPDC056722 TaxID=3345924 RepID=UPI0036C4BEF0